MTVFQDFFTGLQFLTRFRMVKQSDWSPASFGRSVKFFPVIGAVIGVSLAGVNYLLHDYLPPHILAAIIVLAGIVITGGLHCDGLMDTADGIFSGRSRERMLEIMKDSRVGANGVVVFGLFILLKWSLILDMNTAILSTALFVAPVAARLAMVIGITSFPYARPDGMGKAFAQYAGRPALYLAFFFSFILIVPLGKLAIISLTASVLCCMVVARYVTSILGGLTGDVYGAITELGELVTLAVFGIIAYIMI
ncbi:MAG TPA: adenosylcobinamide-GDP ribazoletransferase [Methylomusa anaerophila]|nr:adenosylcobinamide-GDP ribazoletransferase [Methylomusa anaerophila]HML86886.1 adenosylcobinamide-GDP ribazoletransferase [Methylomusa anaerophila]